MLPRYRVQVRKQVGLAEGDGEGAYVFRDLELPFAPVPGMVIEDLGGERFRLDEVVWHEGQHRFVVHTQPLRGAAADRPLEAVLAELEAQGWQRNRRTEERTAA